MDIGSLTGAIKIEDQGTSVLRNFGSHVQRFAESTNGALGAIAIGAGVATSAVLGTAASIVALGTKGSVILAVEKSFDSLARQAGSTGEALLGGLNEGVKGTIDSMVLMQATTRLLSSGVKLNAEDMKLMGATAREMGKATGTDAAGGLNTLSMAMLTGNQRALKRFGIQIDLVKAEKDFAAKIGTTREQLSQAGKLEAARAAMLDGMRAKLGALGVSEVSFKERLQQSTVAIGNWFDDLAKGVAGSAAVNGAFDAIRASLVETFGSNSQTLLQSMLSGVDSFANAVANWGPVIIGWMGRVRDGIMSVWNWLKDLNERYQITNTIVSVAKQAWGLLESAFYLVKDAVAAVINAWKTMPEWLQRITRSALEATLVVSAYSVAIGAVATPMRSLAETIDLGINMVGNFTGAIFNITELADEWAKVTVWAANAQKALMAATLASTTATNAGAVANNFWSSTSLVMGARMAWTTAATYASSVANTAAATTTGVWATAVAYLGSTKLVLGARLAAATTLTGVATVVETAATAATIAFGTAVNVLSFAIKTLIPGLAAFYAGLKMGEWLEKNTQWAKDMADGFHTLGGIILTFNYTQSKASTEAYRAAQAYREQKSAVDELARSQAEAAAQEEKRQRQKLTGEDLATEFEQLRIRYNGLTEAEKASAYTKNQVGEAASRLGKALGYMHPELRALAAEYDASQAAGTVLTGGLIKVNDRVAELAKTIRGSELVKQVNELNAALGTSKLDEASTDRAVEAAESLSGAGAKLTGRSLELWVANKKWLEGLPLLNQQNRDLSGALSVISSRTTNVTDRLFNNNKALDGMRGIVGHVAAAWVNLGNRVEIFNDKSMNEVAEAGYKTKAQLQMQADTARRVYTYMSDANRGYTKEAIAHAKARAEALQREADGSTKTVREMASEILSAFGDMFEGINSRVGQAIHIFARGMETMVDAAKSGGARVAAGLAAAAGALSAILGDNPNKYGQAAIGALSGAAAGAGIGFMLGNAPGAAIGAAIGGAVGALGGWIGAQKKAREADRAATEQIRKYQKELISTYGSLSNISIIGRVVGVDLAAAWGDRSRAGLEHFNRLMEEFKAKLELVQGAMDRFGLTWKDLGEEMRQLNINMAGDAIAADIEALVDAGADYDKVIKGASSSMSQLIIDAIETGTKIPAAMAPALKRMIELGLITDDAARAMLGLARDSMPALADIKDAADRYGISLDSLGPKVKQLQITELANQYVADWKILTAATDDWGVLFDKMGPKVQELVTDAIKYGSELPAAMKPMIQAFIDAGQLVDANGDKLTDLSQLTFAADLSEMFETLIDKLDDLISTITDGVGGALSNLGNTKVSPIVIPYTYEQVGSEPQTQTPGNTQPAYYATGGVVVPFTPRGTDVVPAMLTPGERVLSVNENRDYEKKGDETMVVQLVMADGRELARATVPWIPGELRRIGVRT